ncbi:unnamed protein product [Brugia timori]|uniref:Uncharacterized protein n=1 Tax=Brugia timori TaxID=42155 RepID=A0A0R3QVW1_9BILA|nr:unnamed protein product [Brugia timori]
MFVELYNGKFTVPQMAIFIMVVILLILSLVITINCYMECCRRRINDLRRYKDQQFFDKEYYDGICTLLYRHNKVETRQMGEDWELELKKETRKESTRQKKLLQERIRTNPEKFLLLKDELEPLKINHDVEIRKKTTTMGKMVSKRRTWIGIDDDGRFEQVQMPNANAIQKVQTACSFQVYNALHLRKGINRTRNNCIAPTSFFNRSLSHLLKAPNKFQKLIIFRS